MSSLNCGAGLLSGCVNPASRSASVIASIVEGGTENPSASFSGSMLVSVAGGGDNGSFSSGIESWVVPLIADEVLASKGVFEVVPLGVSVLLTRAALGDSGGSDVRPVCESRLNGEVGRSAAVSTSRSLDLPLPNPLKAEPRLDDDLRSGEDALP